MKILPANSEGCCIFIFVVFLAYFCHLVLHLFVILLWEMPTKWLQIRDFPGRLQIFRHLRKRMTRRQDNDKKTTAQNRNDKQLQKQMTKKWETNAQKNAKYIFLFFQCLQAQDFPNRNLRQFIYIVGKSPTLWFGCACNLGWWMVRRQEIFLTSVQVDDRNRLWRGENRARCHQICIYTYIYICIIKYVYVYNISYNIISYNIISYNII